MESTADPHHCPAHSYLPISSNGSTLIPTMALMRTELPDKNNNKTYSDSPVRYGTWRRKIRLIEGNAICRQLTKTCKGTLRQVFICLRPRVSYSPLPLTHCKRVYSTVHLFTQGRGGEEWES
jgi:hypothetical protein